MIAWISTHHGLSILLAVLFALLALHSRGRARALSLAARMVEKGQFETMDPHLLDQAINHAKNQGKALEFFNELTAVRSKYGEDGLRNGHLYWIWGRVSGEIDDPEPPSFVPKST